MSVAKEASNKIQDIESSIANVALGMAVYAKGDPEKGLAILNVMDYHVGRLLRIYADAKGMTVDEWIEWKRGSGMRANERSD